MDRVNLTNDRFVGINEEPFFVAEIGNNHNGSLEIAKQLIDQAYRVGANCAKFQLRHIFYEKYVPFISILKLEKKDHKFQF